VLPCDYITVRQVSMTNETKKGVKKMTHEIEITLCDLKIEFDRVTTWEHDWDYGSDADGNRGIKTYIVDEDNAENITVLGVPLEQYPEPFQKTIENEVNWWLEENEPTREI